MYNTYLTQLRALTSDMAKFTKKVEVISTSICLSNSKKLIILRQLNNNVCSVNHFYWKLIL